MTKNKILLISPEGWGNNFVSKHHYAFYLSKKYEVFFLNPTNRSKLNPFSKVEIAKKKINPNLTVVDYFNLLPLLNNFPKFIQKLIYKIQAKQLQKALGVNQFDIVWSFDPYRFWNQKHWNAIKYIYHTVDVHFVKCFEEEISASSDIVLLSSELLREKLSNTNSNIFNIGHASDIDNFIVRSQSIPGTNKIKAGLVGNFNNNVDYSLIREIAEKNTEIDFIFIGPYESNNLNRANDQKLNIDSLKIIDNVYFMGAKPSSEIYSWLSMFDINLVLYKEDKRDIIINPHKMMGYFYAGKITVCSWFNEYKNAENEFVYVSNKNSEIPELIKIISGNLEYWNSIELQETRRQFAIDNSYDKKIQEISKLLYKND